MVRILVSAKFLKEWRGLSFAGCERRWKKKKKRRKKEEE